MNKIGIKKVEVTRAEGPSHLCGTKIVSTLAEANEILVRNAETAPKGGAYDKHDFLIEFEDGEVYQGRIDVHHPSYEKPEKIGEHVIHHLRFYGGLCTPEELPSHFTPEKYRNFITQQHGGTINSSEYVEFLNKYNLAD